MWSARHSHSACYPTTFDGDGSLTRCAIADGYDGPTWRTQISVDGEPLAFKEAEGIGRLWTLGGASSGASVRLASFLDEDSSAVFQRVSVVNESRFAAEVRVGLEFTAGPKRSGRERVRNHYARLVARLPGTELWWAVSGAKISLPFAAKSLRVLPGGRIGTKGPFTFIWSADREPEVVSASGGRGRADFRLRLAPGQGAELSWTLRRGDDDDAALKATGAGAALESARGYAAWLGSRYAGNDVLLKSIFVAGLNAAVSMFKEFPLDFRGLVAGPDYAYPPRLYFRDGYWTAQILLRFRPDLVRKHLLSLARGVHPDGQCPSGVFAPHLLGAHAGARVASLDWLPDHYDSPAFFSLLVADYVAATGELSFLDATVRTWDGKEENDTTIWTLARKAAEYLSRKDTDGDGLIEKPYAANDWADNVRRNVWVTYDQALYAASLFAVEKLARARGEISAADRYRELAGRAKLALNEALWNEELGHFSDYRRPGYSENHFALDTLVALRYGLVDSDKTDRLLASARKMQTGSNREQGYGDWGVMCAYPRYGRRRDLFGNSAYPLRYHNGADWPYWDGVYGLILLERGDPEWRYAVTRWWEYGLSRGWLTPVEYYSPPYEPGGMLQGWSAMPAVACAEAEKAR